MPGCWENIVRYDPAENSSQKVLSSESGFLYARAGYHGELYFTSCATPGSLEVLEPNASLPRIILSDFATDQLPDQVDVDSGGNLFLTEPYPYNTGLYFLRPNWTNPAFLSPSGIAPPNKPFAVDEDGDTLYWADNGRNPAI